MKKSLLWTFCLLCFPCHFLSAQSWENDYHQLYDPDEMESAQWEEMSDLLYDLEQHPFNLNTATKEQLSQLPFLSDEEIEDICVYLYRYAPIKSFGELAMIESLDAIKRRLLQCFVFLGEEEKEHLSESRGHHEVMATIKVPLYERNGDRSGYLGDRYRHQLRYAFRQGDHWRAGLIGAKDSGEPFFSNRNSMGYDFYSFYLMCHRVGIIKTLVAGKYRMSMGMGLVMNSDFLLGKSAALTSLGRQRQILRAHSSASSANYLQGMAATIQLSRSLQVTPFLSYRPVDGTLNSDTLSISALVEGGYHRTASELRKKNNTFLTTAGTAVSYKNGAWHAAMNLVYSHLSRPLRPNTKVVYRCYYPQGSDFMNMSIDYGYTHHRLSFHGETAIDRKGTLATLNTTQIRMSSELSMMVLQRFYGMRYTSLQAQAFSEGGRVQNESGLYVGAHWQPSRKLLASAYADVAYFAWPRYQASASSYHQDYLLSLSYLTGNWNLSTRYRLRIKEKDDEQKSALYSRQEHRGRVAVCYDGTMVSTKTQVDFACIKNENNSRGWTLSQLVNWKMNKIFHTHLAAAYFHTDDYDSRMYLYERGMLYNFSFPVVYGRGIRYSLLLRAQLSEKFMIHARVAVINYFDRSVIGSGYQQVNSSSLPSLELQIRWKL